jgi:hypothetical protein
VTSASVTTSLNNSTALHKQHSQLYKVWQNKLTQSTADKATVSTLHYCQILQQRCNSAAQQQKQQLFIAASTRAPNGSRRIEAL